MLTKTNYWFTNKIIKNTENFVNKKMYLYTVSSLINIYGNMNQEGNFGN